MESIPLPQSLTRRPPIGEQLKGPPMWHSYIGSAGPAEHRRLVLYNDPSVTTFLIILFVNFLGFSFSLAMADYVPPAIVTLSEPRENPPSDDDDDESRRRVRSAAPAAGGGGGEPSSGSAGRKPRGRPPGSKNKPKPPLVITRESEAAMHPMVLELAAGFDVLECVAAFARRRRMGISILSGSGVVANVPLRHPTTNPPVMTLHGRYDILSLSGTILPQPAAAAQSTFSISLAGTQGHVIGGTVAGPLKAAGPVILVAASFVNPEFYRLPLAVAAAEDDEAAAAAKEEDVKPGGVEVYGVPGGPCLLTGPLPHHDMVLWAQPPSARSPHPPPPHY